MILKTQAICIKNTRFGESGIICKLFTLDRGVASFIIQGINGKKSLIKISQILPGNIIEIVYYKKPSASVNRIKEVKLTDSFYDKENEILKNAILQFVLEIVSKTNEEEAVDEGIFYFIKHSIQALKNEAIVLNSFPIIFLCKYLKYSGWYPNLDIENNGSNFNLNEGKFTDKKDIDDKYFLDSVTSKQLYDVFEIAEKYDYTDNINTYNNKEIMKHLILYYEIHLLKGKKVKSPEILSELLK